MRKTSEKMKPEDIREGYKGWNPFEDYMCNSGGWNRRLEFESWKDFKKEFIPFDPNYNQIIDFYFQRYKPTKNCESCGARGYSPRALEIESELHERLGVGREAFDRLTNAERDVLRQKGRLSDSPLGLDSLSKGVLIVYHTALEGISEICEDCKGNGEIVIGRERLGLNLWMTHPRKGASKGIYITLIQEKELPKVYALLNDAKDRLIERFKNVPHSDVKINYGKGFQILVVR